MRSKRHETKWHWLAGREWKNSLGEYHREHGPAIEAENGEKGWLQFGKWHRIGGPAREHNDGHKVWIENDVLIRESDSEKETT